MSESEAPELATTRSMFAAWNESDVQRMTEFWTEDGDWIWEDFQEVPGAGTVRGSEDVEAHLRELTSLLGGLNIEVESMSMLGDEVFAEIHFAVAGARSGVNLVDDSFCLIGFDGGRVRRFRSFLERGQALEAAGAG